MAAILARMREAGFARGLQESDLKPMTQEEKARKDAADLNRQAGSENLIDGYECEKCRNRGHIYIARGVYVSRADCDCMNARRSIRRMLQSGLGPALNRYTFERYRADEPWQQCVKEAAQAFSEDAAGHWFFIGGASGAGKSHLCTAICRNLLTKQEVHYMLWEDEAPEIKGMITDGERYAQRVNRLKDVDVLYIDDFFSNRRDAGPSDADIRLAREILNHRVVNRKTTIISTEWYSSEILDVDTGLGGRIYEMCGEQYCWDLERGQDKNYRLKLGGVRL